MEKGVRPSRIQLAAWYGHRYETHNCPKSTLLQSVVLPARLASCTSSSLCFSPGVIKSVAFSTTFQSLPRIRVECDVDNLGLLYHHVFTETGCADGIFQCSLVFTSDAGSVFDPNLQATGCRRVRILAQRSTTASALYAPLVV